MKNTALLLGVLLAASVSSAAEKPTRKAVVTCEFIQAINAAGQITELDVEKNWTKFSYSIDLDSKKVKVSCAVKGACMIDRKSVTHTIAGRVSMAASLAPIVEKGDRFTSYSTNMPALNIEGSNGDSLDMFTRITFSASQGELSATAVLIVADEGNDGDVSAPVACSVKAARAN